MASKIQLLLIFAFLFEVSAMSAVSKDDKTASNSSKAISVVFIYAAFFGIFVAILITFWLFVFLKNNCKHRLFSRTSNLIPTQNPKIFDETKPVVLKVDTLGRFYAVPFSKPKIPSVPTYDAALNLPKTVSAKHEKPNIFTTLVKIEPPIKI